MIDEFDENDLGALSKQEPDITEPMEEPELPIDDVLQTEEENTDTSTQTDTDSNVLPYYDDVYEEDYSDDDSVEEEYSKYNYTPESNITSETVNIDQDAEIAAAEPSEKKSLKNLNNKKINHANFFNRSRLIFILLFVAVLFIVFFSLFAPKLKLQKKKTKSETSKAGKTYIPTELTRYEVENENNNDIVPDYTEGNSSIQTSKENAIEEKFPPIVEPKEKEKVAPISVPSSSNKTNNDFPITNRNEQQKQLQHIPLEKTPNMNGITSNQSNYNSYYGNYGNTEQTGAYTPYSLSANMDKYLSTYGQSDNSYWQQNNQTQKNEFLNKNGIGGNYQWNSEYSIWKGTIISVVLDTGINTDLPGSVMGHVTKNVYSSQDSKYLLIPQGSRLYGEYNSEISYGQNRIQVVWNTLIRPDGLEINLGNMNGIDQYGKSGYKGFKTNHPFEYLKSFGLIAMYSIIDTKANNLIDSATNKYAENVMTDVYSETKRLNNKIVDRALDIQPTNTIKSGTEVNLITNVTIDIPPLEPYEVTEKYIRTK